MKNEFGSRTLGPMVSKRRALASTGAAAAVVAASVTGATLAQNGSHSVPCGNEKVITRVDQPQAQPQVAALVGPALTSLLSNAPSAAARSEVAWQAISQAWFQSSNSTVNGVRPARSDASATTEPPLIQVLETLAGWTIQNHESSEKLLQPGDDDAWKAGVAQILAYRIAPNGTNADGLQRLIGALPAQVTPSSLEKLTSLAHSLATTDATGMTSQYALAAAYLFQGIQGTGRAQALTLSIPLYIDAMTQSLGVSPTNAYRYANQHLFPEATRAAQHSGQPALATNGVTQLERLTAEWLQANPRTTGNAGESLSNYLLSRGAASFVAGQAATVSTLMHASGFSIPDGTSPTSINMTPVGSVTYTVGLC